MSRTKKSKTKKRKFIFSLLLIVAFLLILPASYLAWEYYSSYKASENMVKNSKKPVDFNGDDFEGMMNVLLVGVDSRGEDVSNSDTIMIAQYDTDKKKAKLVSLMRDMYVDIPGFGQKRKINAAYLMGGEEGGLELLRETIKQNFDIDIHYYAIVDFQGFIHSVDAAFPDGIEIDVEKRMSENIYVTLKPGLRKLNGKELLGYARFRADAENDYGRVERQQKVIQTVTDELMSLQGVTKLPKMIGTVVPYIDTNIEKTRMVSVLTSFLASGNTDIEKLRIPVNDSFEESRVPTEDGKTTLVLEIDLEKNKESLQEFLETE
ncbi:MAG: LCP family protein [Bacillus sp. (in: firmicutes)]